MFSTLKEDGLCIERLRASWNRGKKQMPQTPHFTGHKTGRQNLPILEFGRIHYENVAYFNFETNPKLNKTFEENIIPDYLIPILSQMAENYVNV